MEESKKRKILIVDDDTFLLNMYSQKFTNSGFEVVTSMSSEDALKRLKEGCEPDVMMLDIIMPNMDGLELLEEVRNNKLCQKSVVIMLTNQGGSAEIEKSKDLGVNGYIVKATTIPSEVVEEVVKILEKSKK